MSAGDSGRKGFFSSDSLERVRNSSDIASIIGRYIELKRAGSSLKGLCPFHKEKTPSFFVSKERQSYHCFGCGAGGDVFSFLMNYLSMSFPDAVEELAAEAGIELEAGRADPSRSDGLRDIMTDAHRFFVEQLAQPGAIPAREYLKTRDFSVETLERLGVGWAPEGSHLTERLRKNGWSDTLIEESGVGLRSRSDPGAVYDRFRGRIIFPIADRRGRIVSFGGRILPGIQGDAPKYLNGPDTPLYRKGELLYGYRDAVRSARDLDMLLLVEGYFDHARLVQAGFSCVTATCGTALTPAQARQLGSVSVDVLVCYDGDAAGRKAAVGAAEVILEQGHLPRIVRIPSGMDPDDYISAEGPDAVLGMTTGALDPVRFALWLLGGWEAAGGPARKVKAVRRLVAIASKATDPVIRETLLKVVCQETGYSMETIREQSSGRTGRKSPVSRAVKTAELGRWDQAVISALLMSPEGISRDLLDFLEDEDLRTPAGVSMLKAIREQAAEGFSSVQLSSMDEELASVLSGLLAELPAGVGEGAVENVKNAVRRHRVEREEERLRLRLTAATGEERTEIQHLLTDAGRKKLKMKRL